MVETDMVDISMNRSREMAIVAETIRGKSEKNTMLYNAMLGKFKLLDNRPPKLAF